MPRCFYCVPLELPVAEALAGFTRSQLPRWLEGWRLALVDPQDLHLTLRFFPSAEGQRLIALEGGLSRLATGPAPAGLVTGRLACWPGLRVTRVVVALVEGGEALIPLAAAAERLACEIGYPPERRPFRAHLTLARVRVAGPPPTVHPPPPPRLPLAVRALALWETLPPGSVRRYRERLRAPLSG